MCCLLSAQDSIIPVNDAKIKVSLFYTIVTNEEVNPELESLDRPLALLQSHSCTLYPLGKILFSQFNTDSTLVPKL